MSFDEAEVLGFVRSCIISLTALEVLLLLKNGRTGLMYDLVRELRSSPLAIGTALRSLENWGLV
jgi:hypothetical protein